MGKLNINNGGVDTNKKMPDIDERYGPYTSIEAANAALGGQGRNTITAGLPVGILTANAGVKEYWYQPNKKTGQLELIPKGGNAADNPTEGNFASFDENGNVVDSGNKAADFAPIEQAVPMGDTEDVGKVLEKQASGFGWVEKPVDGKSALQLYNETYNKHLTQAQFVEEIKANWPMAYVEYDSTAAGKSIGTPFTAIGSLDASEATTGKMYLMPDAASDPENCIGFVTMLDGQAYKWCNVGAIRIPSDVLAKTDVDNECVDGATDEPASAKAVMDLKAKLEGVTAREVKVNAVVGTNVTTGAYVSGETGLLVTPGSSSSSYAYFELAIPQGTKAIRFLAGTKKSGAKLGYSIGYYDEANDNVYVPTRYFYFDNATTPTTNVEKTIKVEEGETVFMATCAGASAYTSITFDSFYCYLRSGESVKEGLDKFEVFRQGYEEYVEVDMNKPIYKTPNYQVKGIGGDVEYDSGWGYIKIPVGDYEKVRFLVPVRTAELAQGYCFKDSNDDYIPYSGQRYPFGETAGTEIVTVDVPEGAYWFYTNYRFAANTTFTNNFFINLIKGDDLHDIVEDAKKDCTDYTDEQIGVVQGEIDDINDAINITESISGLIYGFGCFTWSGGWKPVKTTDSTNKRYLRLYDSKNGSSGIYIPKDTSIKCPSGYTVRYSKYGVNERITQKDRQLLEGGETMTLEADSILYIELRTSSTPLWSIPEGSGYTSAELTEAGEYGFEYLIEHIVTDLGTVSDKIDEVDTRLTSEINKIKENNGSLIIEPTINRTNAVDYHAALDYLCYDLDANSENPKHPILLRSEPTYLMIDENGADTQIENTNYPLYTYTLDMQLMYMLVDAHISQDESLGRAFPSTANSYQVYAPKTGKTYNSVAKPYKYYNDHHSIGAGNYKYNYKSGDPVENLPFDDENNGIFYNDNWINNNKKKILIVSGIHGNEYGAPLGLYEFITRLISDPSYADLLVNCEFTFIPIANPWGYTHNQRDRGNTSINRDFDDYNGFALQETRYIRDVLKQKKFDMVFDLHQHDLTEKNGLFGGFTSFNTAYFETPMQNPDTDTLVSAAVMNGEYNGTYTFTPIGRKIANAINEVCVKTDIAACRYAELEYMQHSFLWINPRMGGTTLKKYGAGERYTIDGQSIGNANGINSGKAAYIVMTCETPITNYWMNSGSASKHNFYARCFANTYINNLLTTMCRKLVNGDFGEPNS